MNVSTSEIGSASCEDFCDLAAECTGIDFHNANFSPEAMFARAQEEGMEISFDENGRPVFSFPETMRNLEVKQEEENEPSDKPGKPDSPAPGDPQRALIIRKADGSVDLAMSNGQLLLESYDHSLGGYDEYVAAIQAALEGGIGIKDHYDVDGFLTDREYFESPDGLHLAMSFEHFEKVPLENAEEEETEGAKIVEQELGDRLDAGILPEPIPEVIQSELTSDALLEQAEEGVTLDGDNEVQAEQAATVTPRTSPDLTINASEIAVTTAAAQRASVELSRINALDSLSIPRVAEITGIALAEAPVDTVLAPPISQARSFNSRSQIENSPSAETSTQAETLTITVPEAGIDLVESTDLEGATETGLPQAETSQEPAQTIEVELAANEASGSIEEEDGERATETAPTVAEQASIETGNAASSPEDAPVAPEGTGPDGSRSPEFDGPTGIDLDPTPIDLEPRDPIREPDPTAPGPALPELPKTTTPEEGPQPIDLSGEDEDFDFNAAHLREVLNISDEMLEIEPDIAPFPEQAPVSPAPEPVAVLRNWVRNGETPSAPHIYRAKLRKENASETPIIPISSREKTRQTLEILSSLRNNGRKQSSSASSNTNDQVLRATTPKAAKKIAA
jgi:hypothetical protein